MRSLVQFQSRFRSRLLFSPLFACIFIFVFVFVASPQAVPAVLEPASLNVRVIDPQGAPVTDARVVVIHRDGLWRLELELELEPDPAGGGSYRAEQLPPGRLFVYAEAEGFARSDPHAVTLSNGESRDVELSIAIAPYSESIVVTSAAAAERESDVTKSMSVVDVQEIEARDEIFMVDALRTLPGLRTQQLGGPGSFASVKTRGLRTEDTAVLVDGARLRDAAAPQGDASPFLESLTLGSVEQVEILRGSGSSLYGTNAGGGVVNIVTASGGGEPSVSFMAEGGGLGLFRAGATTAGAVGDRLLYSVGLTHLDVSQGVDGDDPARNTGFQGRAQVHVTPETVLSVRLFGSDIRLGLNESPFVVGSPADGVVEATPLSSGELSRYENGAPTDALHLGTSNFAPSANDPDNVRDARYLSTLVSFDRRAGETFGYHIRYHGLFSERTFEDGPLGVTAFEPTGVSVSEFNGGIHTLSARGDFQLGSMHAIQLGYELESERLENATSPSGDEGSSATDVTQSSHTVYAQDTMRLLDGALIVAGSVRAQTFSLNEPTLTPEENAPYQNIAFESPKSSIALDVSAGYGIAQSDTRFRAHVGTGYRVPSLFERFGASFSSFGYSVFGDPRLAPERTRTFDVGVEQGLFSGRAEASLTYFRTRLREIIVFDFSGAISPDTDPFGRFGGYRSTDGGTTQGAEVLFSVTAPGGLRLNAAYTYTDAEPPTGVSAEQDRAFVIPRHHLGVVATKSFTERLSLSFDLSAISSYLAPIFDPNTFTSRVYRFDGYVKSDVVASYRLSLGSSHLRLFGKIENLFGEDIYESGFRTPGRWAVAGVAVEF